MIAVATILFLEHKESGQGAFYWWSVIVSVLKVLVFEKKNISFYSKTAMCNSNVTGAGVTDAENSPVTSGHCVLQTSFSC